MSDDGVLKHIVNGIVARVARLLDTGTVDDRAPQLVPIKKRGGTKVGLSDQVPHGPAGTDLPAGLAAIPPTTNTN